MPKVAWIRSTGHLADSELLQLIQCRDEQAESELYFRLRKSLVAGRVRKRLGSIDKELHDDILNEAYCIILENIRGGFVDKPESLDSYIYAVCWRRLSDFVRSRISQRDFNRTLESCAHHGSRWLFHRPPTPEQILLSKEYQQIVNRALSKLNQKDRDVLTSFFYSEESRSHKLEEIRVRHGLTRRQLADLKYKAMRRFWAKLKMVVPPVFLNELRKDVALAA